MRYKISPHDTFGLIHPSLDVHTLGILSFARMIEECGVRTEIADAEVGHDIERIRARSGGGLLRSWLTNKGITALGFSYRLDPDDAVGFFDALYEYLLRWKLLARDGGSIHAIFFAGLPDACKRLSARYPDLTACFHGDETPHETLAALGIPEALMPRTLSESVKYDLGRLEFGKNIVEKGEYMDTRPVDRSGYPGYGVRGDSVVRRIAEGKARKLPPLIRVHAGPYLPDRKEAVRLFIDWVKRLANGGYLDILSIGTSQLTQSNFGDDWEEKINGGGVPIANPEEFAEVWKAARPMLVRTYAGTRGVPALAKMYEKTIDIAWHALSFWWFCKLDGRGPNSVGFNLEEHFETLRYIASTGKPFEPNVPHHFAFRGADDLSYVVSGYVAAKAAKIQGIRSLILQIMLNTPKYTWGIQDIAKARALLKLVKSLEDDSFKVYVQPRGGLDYFSPDPVKAKAQLAAVTALMDDIEPAELSSPQIIHVVSYSEGTSLADPPVIEESIKLTRYALSEYRRRKAEGALAGADSNPETAYREQALYEDARAMIAAIETLIPRTYTPEGFYRMLASGVFAVPWLTACRDEFVAAGIQTRIVDGGVRAVDERGAPLTVPERVELIKANLSAKARGGGGNVGKI